MSNKISTRILKTDNINWQELQFIQQDDFKEIGQWAKQRLKHSLIYNDFVQPFYVWQAPDKTIYCLDGKHRVVMLEELIATGDYNVPDELPAIFIDCKNKQDAALLVLVFSSTYAKVTQQGLYEFISINDIDFTEIKETIDLPGLSLETMKDWFYLNRLKMI